MDATLVCPDCATEHGGDERFCPHCGMPLVPGGGEAVADDVSERRRQARKIRPEYAQGALVKAAWARNQVEAELIAGMLLEEGIPSLLRRAAAFDVPDFMAAGPRDVLVPQSGLQAARDVLLVGGDGAPLVPGPPAGVAWRTKLAAAVLLAIALVAIVLFMATHVWD
jgi:hypothetical protein